MATPQTEVLTAVAGMESARFVLAPGDYVIGRNEDCPIRVDADLVSRTHAKLTLNYDHALIEDLGSSNGTQVNGQPIAKDGRTRLWPNQKIQVGTATIELRRLKVEVSDLSLAPSAAMVKRILPEEFLREKKYDIGKVVAQGGMGAILNAKEATTERTVAMKVMLDTNDADGLARFLNEAKITAQLEHPNIVPVHELSVDENGQPYYTMKMVRGITLKKVLELMAAGTAGTLKKYPLPTLLTIFQKVCDALAFAHSKGVIHRDLKPENLMLGDYGEVLVMDWGLAKRMRNDEGRMRNDGTAPPEEIHTIRSTLTGADGGAANLRHSSSDIRHSALAEATLAGTIMGTPQFMSPEQARGEVETLDARSDIYSLGAILYQILSLRVPVTGTDAMEVVGKVGRGEIEPLTSPQSKIQNSKLNIPASLAAVVRKAMALDREQRYASVAKLQRDLESYQTGFATSAEKAGWWKRASLAIKRNKAASIGAAAVLLVGTVLGTKAILEGKRAEREAAVAKTALANLKASAPALLKLAESEADTQHFADALRDLDAALALDGSLARARWRRAWVLLAQEKFTDATDALRHAAEKDPANTTKLKLLPLVEKLLAAPVNERHGNEIIQPLYQHLTSVGALGESLTLLPHLQLAKDKNLKVVSAQVERWLGKSPGGGAAPATSFDKDGKLQVSLSGLRIGDLTPLRGLPIDLLAADNCGITTLESLRSMKLKSVRLNRNAITDLSPLAGMPLEYLTVQDNEISDLSPLHGMPLKNLLLDGNPAITDLRPLSGLPLDRFSVNSKAIKDFSALRGMPITLLNLTETNFKDARVLAGMPLDELSLNRTPLEGLEPLAGLPLRTLRITSCPIKDFTPLSRIPTLETLVVTAPLEKLLPLRAHPRLKTLKYDMRPERPVAEVWAEYDAQQAAKKK